MYDAKDKVVLVTGGSVGIGAEVVKAFLDAGAKHVALLDLDVNNGKALETELASKHGMDKVFFYKCDVTSDDLHSAYDSVLKKFGYIDVVVNNAGILNDSPKAYEKMIAVNLATIAANGLGHQGGAYASRSAPAALSPMRLRGPNIAGRTALITSSLKAYHLMRKDHGGKGGTIINISSIISLMNARYLPIYGATKSAVLQFSRSLGMEPHYSRSEVRVVTMCFGCTDTFLMSALEAIDDETSTVARKSLKYISLQKPESAARGVVEAYRRGDSASTWLVTSDKPAEDISTNVIEGYKILGHGVF